MSASSRIRNLVLAKLAGAEIDVAAFVDELLGLAKEVRAIRCYMAANGSLRFEMPDLNYCEVELDSCRGKLRMLCARLSVLCNETDGQAVSPYGGEGTIETVAASQERTRWKVHFKNTSSEQEFAVVAVKTASATQAWTQEDETDRDAPQPVRTRPLIYAISGAMAGFVLGACSIWVEIVVNAWGHWPSLVEFFHFWSPLERNLWHFVIQRGDRVLIGGPLSGVVGGMITTVFSDRLRHPVACAALWASILAAPVLVTRILFPDGGFVEAVANVAVCLALGAMYGFLLASVARLLHRWLDKIERRSSNRK